jgi:hypothetical protein
MDKSFVRVISTAPSEATFSPIMRSPPTPQQQVSMMWTVWLAVTAVIPVYPFVLGGGLPGGVDVRSPVSSPILWLCLFWLLAAAVVRWRVLSRTTQLRKMLVWMIVGLAASETVMFHALFLIPRDLPETKRVLVVASFLSALQFVPVYAKRGMAQS